MASEMVRVWARYSLWFQGKKRGIFRVVATVWITIRLARSENPQIHADMHLRISSLAIVAQLVEHFTRNEEVAGSIPADGSKIEISPVFE